jgi:hypothetical protein
MFSQILDHAENNCALMYRPYKIAVTLQVGWKQYHKPLINMDKLEPKRTGRKQLGRGEMCIKRKTECIQPRSHKHATSPSPTSMSSGNLLVRNSSVLMQDTKQRIACRLECSQSDSKVWCCSKLFINFTKHWKVDVEISWQNTILTLTSRNFSLLLE